MNDETRHRPSQREGPPRAEPPGAAPRSVEERLDELQARLEAFERDVCVGIFGMAALGALRAYALAELLREVVSSEVLGATERNLRSLVEVEAAYSSSPWSAAVNALLRHGAVLRGSDTDMAGGEPPAA